MLLKKILKYLLLLLSLPILYLIVSIILTSITINKSSKNSSEGHTVYLSSNGVHLDIVIPKHLITPQLISDLKILPNNTYLAFRWGDENFYLYTPQWKDLTFNNAFKALFLKSSTLVHLTKYNNIQKDWVKIDINDTELNKLNLYINKTFKLDKFKNKIIIPNKGYSLNDDFYYANGSYSCFKTCNSWVNSAFKESGLKSCLWTPFDFGLLNKYH